MEAQMRRGFGYTFERNSDHEVPIKLKSVTFGDQLAVWKDLLLFPFSTSSLLSRALPLPTLPNYPSLPR
jgi:hypothetical protein